MKLSEDHANLDAEASQRILALLKHFQLPLVLDSEISTDLVLEKLSRDKKFAGGKRTFVLLDQPGHALTCSTIPFEDIAPAIDHLRS